MSHKRQRPLAEPLKCLTGRRSVRLARNAVRLCTPVASTSIPVPKPAVADATRHRRDCRPPLPGDLFQGQRHGEPAEGATAPRGESNRRALDSEGGKRPSLSVHSGMGRVRPQTEAASV